jgi:ATP-binding cassette, subfamily B, multidrug efflux pump
MATDSKPNFTGRPAGGPHSHYFSKTEKPKNARGTFSRLLAYIGEKKWALLPILLFAFVTTMISIAGTRLNGWAVDECIRKGDARGLLAVCGIMFGMYLVNVFATYVQNALAVHIAQNTSSRIREDLFAKTQTLPLPYFDGHPSGDIMSRLTNDVDNINVLFSQGIVQLFSGIIMITGTFIAMAMLSLPLTIIAIALLPLMFLSTKLIVKATQPYFTAQQKELGRLNAFTEEMISGQKTVTLFSRQESVEKDFGSINRRYVDASIKAQGYSGSMGPLNNAINNLGYLIVCAVGAILVIKGLGPTVGTVFSFILYMRTFTRPINEIMNLFNTVQSALAGGERVFELMDEKPETDRDGARDIGPVSGDVRLENVVFSYRPEKPVLKGVSISARPGQTIAIVGPTGAGKTTIINLLTRFYDFESGSIKIDGTDIREITAKSLRKKISIVLQDPYLFSESVRDNIRYGKLDATDEETETAAKQARAHDFIERLERGYDTVLADNGSNLSQGQRQLLSIARAIIADSSILILDEATSSIDTRTELLIQDALLTLMKGKTSFVIAHRLSTIRKADSIIVISGGVVAEQGTHDELIAKNGYYAELYNGQFSSGIAL